MSTAVSRKTFFAKLGGLFLAAGIVPKVFARSERTGVAVPPSFQLRPEARAVARQDGAN